MLSWDLYLNGAQIIEMKRLMFYAKKMSTITIMNLLCVLNICEIKVSTYWALAHIVSCDADYESHEQ